MADPTLDDKLLLSILNTSQDVKNVLYIEDASKQGDTLELTLHKSDLDVALYNDSNGNVNEQNYSFYIKFQPNVLSKENLRIKVKNWDASKNQWDSATSSDWSTASEDTSDDSLIIYFLSKQPISLKKDPDQSFMIVFTNTKPDVDISMATDVELVIKKEDRSEYCCKTYLNIINHKGDRNIPIKVDVEGGQLLIGATNNLRLSLTNIGQDDIKFNDSKIQVSWGLGSHSYDLISGDYEGTIDIFGKSASNKDNKGKDPVYEPESSYTHILKKDESLEIKISGLEPNPKPGISNLYINYYDVPGYWDGQLVVPLMRTAMIQDVNGNVGIGKIPNNEYKLHVGGNAKVEGNINTDGNLIVNGTGTSSFTGPLTVGGDLNLDGNILLTDGNKWIGLSETKGLYISSDGNVGIGTSKPIAPLSIGDSSVSGSDGFLVISKQVSNGGARNARIGYDAAFNFVIGDYGNQYGNEEWISQFLIHWEALPNSFVINSEGNVGIGTATPKSKLEVMGTFGMKSEIDVQQLADATIYIFTHAYPNNYNSKAYIPKANTCPGRIYIISCGFKSNDLTIEYNLDSTHTFKYYTKLPTSKDAYEGNSEGPTVKPEVTIMIVAVGDYWLKIT